VKLSLDLIKPLNCDMFGRMMQRNGWHRKYTHVNENHLLVFVISGSAIFHVGEERISLLAGDVLVILGNCYSVSLVKIGISGQ